MQQMEQILSALSAIRAERLPSEYDLHALIADALQSASIPFRHEVRVAPRRRIDFIAGTIGIELNRGKPLRAPLLRQLSAYAASDSVTALLLVAERPPAMPATLHGKPLRALSLSRLWGVAL